MGMTQHTGIQKLRDTMLAAGYRQEAADMLDIKVEGEKLKISVEGSHILLENRGEIVPPTSFPVPHQAVYLAYALGAHAPMMHLREMTGSLRSTSGPSSSFTIEMKAPAEKYLEALNGALSQRLDAAYPRVAKPQTPKPRGFSPF